MKKRTALLGILFLLLTACGRRDTSEINQSTSAENAKELQKELSAALTNQESSELNFAPKAFTTSEGILAHQFSGCESVDFKGSISSDGQYFLLFTAWGDNDAEMQISSDALGFQNQAVPITPDSEYGLWKLVELTAGEYTFTAETLNDSNCNLMAVIRPLQRLEFLPDTLTGSLPATYLCTFSEDVTLSYTFWDERDSQDNATYGPMAAFYLVGDDTWGESIDMKKGAKEAIGSISLPAGDIIICFHTSNWRIKLESSQA